MALLSHIIYFNKPPIDNQRAHRCPPQCKFILNTTFLSAGQGRYLVVVAALVATQLLTGGELHGAAM